MNKLGENIHALVKELFPICRSLTGNGVRETLDVLGELIPLERHELPTGTNVFDWTVPDEWNISSAYIEEVGGGRVIDFADNNLHVVGYSEPIDTVVDLETLQNHIYSLPDQPDAIPYVTSYYKRRWGFCLTENQRKKLKNTKFHCVIHSTLEPGSLTYADCLIPGNSEKEVLLTSYVCHPSMANNELSGPAVLTFITRWLLEHPRRYSYRIVFAPETIGAISYISNNLESLQANVIAGFNLSCIGDELDYSYVASRYGDSYADRAAKNYLELCVDKHTKYSFLERGSDERQYCSPGVDLPLVTLCRSKFGAYPQYHTSLDNLDFVTPNGLAGGYDFVKKCIECIEDNYTYQVKCLCEPQLGKRGLYPDISMKGPASETRTMTNLIAYMDGSNDLLAISDIIGVPVHRLTPIISKLLQNGLIKKVV